MLPTKIRFQAKAETWSALQASSASQLFYGVRLIQFYQAGACDPYIHDRINKIFMRKFKKLKMLRLLKYKRTFRHLPRVVPNICGNYHEGLSLEPFQVAHVRALVYLAHCIPGIGQTFDRKLGDKIEKSVGFENDVPRGTLCGTALSRSICREGVEQVKPGKAQPTERVRFAGSLPARYAHGRIVGLNERE